MSFWLFFVEGIFEAGFIQSTFYSAYSEKILFSIFFSIYSLVALFVAVACFFSIKKINSEEIYNKKRNIYLLIINILTIIICLILIFINKGLMPRL